jgi:hypothetical protein
MAKPVTWTPADRRLKENKGKPQKPVKKGRAV